MCGVPGCNDVIIIVLWYSTEVKADIITDAVILYPSLLKKDIRMAVAYYTKVKSNNVLGYKVGRSMHLLRKTSV